MLKDLSNKAAAWLLAPRCASCRRLLATPLADPICAACWQCIMLPAPPWCERCGEPLMAAGNWMPELVEIAGGVNLFGVAGPHSPYLSWSDFCAADPDVILLLPCGWDIERTRQDLPVFTQRPEWSRLKAVAASRVYLLDGNQFFNRPGPRLVESLEILAELLHPDHFHFGHQGKGWAPGN